LLYVITPTLVRTGLISNTSIICFMKALMISKFVSPTLPEESITNTTSASFAIQGGCVVPVVVGVVGDGAVDGFCVVRLGSGVVDPDTRISGFVMRGASHVVLETRFSMLYSWVKFDTKKT